MMFGGARGEMEALLPVLVAELGSAARIERTVYPSTGVVLLDVLDASVGKAEALGFLQERWGIASSETLAIGDNWNDREMVERAGRGFVMGNADPELLALGLCALPTNDEDGVAHAIEEHVLRAYERRVAARCAKRGRSAAVGREGRGATQHRGTATGCGAEPDSLGRSGAGSLRGATQHPSEQKKWGARLLSTPPTSPGLLLLLLRGLLLGSLLLRRH